MPVGEGNRFSIVQSAGYSAGRTGVYIDSDDLGSRFLLVNQCRDRSIPASDIEHSVSLVQMLGELMSQGLGPAVENDLLMQVSDEVEDDSHDSSDVTGMDHWGKEFSCVKRSAV